MQILNIKMENDKSKFKKGISHGLTQMNTDKKIEKNLCGWENS